MSTLFDDENPTKRFGEKLRTLRRGQKMSQQALAEVVGVTRGFIAQMELGEKIPNVAMLLKVSRYFEVSADVLIKDELDLEA